MIHSTYPRKHPDDFIEIEDSIETFVLPGFIPQKPLIGKQSIIRTQGSCFAENIHNEIQRMGYDSRFFSFPEAVNSPIANRVLFERVSGQSSFGNCDEHENLFSADLVSQISSMIPREDLFIFTVGLSGCWYDADQIVPIINPDIKKISQYKFKWLTAEENSTHLDSIIQILKNLNPKIKIVLTLSPVPLNRAFGFESPVVADCISKSTLRVAINEVIKKNDSCVYYWPSFEIVRWLGSHLQPVFGTDDGLSRHISENLVTIIVKLFLKYFSNSPVK